MRVMDEELSSFLVKIQASIQGLHARHIGASAPGVAPFIGGQGDDGEEISNTLKVLLTYADLASGLSRLEAELR
jgi:DNA transposition AAA+ family ATPase